MIGTHRHWPTEKGPTTTTSEGRRHVGEDCTLNGRPATICGRLNDAGTVAQHPDGLRADYAWPTIARIMAAGGAFTA